MNGVEGSSEQAQSRAAVHVRSFSVSVTMAAAAAARAAAMCGQAASSRRGTPSPLTAEMRKNGSSRSRRARVERVHPLEIVHRVHLVGGDELRFRQQLRIVERQLAANGLEVVQRIAARRARHIDEMNQHFRALDVTQELVAEPVPFACALDQTGHVGDDEAAVVTQSRQRRDAE